MWSDPARSSKRRHRCRKRELEDDEEERPRVKRRKLVDSEAEPPACSQGEAHASSSRLQGDTSAVLNPRNGPTAGPSGASYTDYSHGLAFGADDAGVLPDFLQANGHWLPQPSFTLNDFRTSTVTPVQLDAPASVQPARQPLGGHRADEQQYYNEPGPSSQRGVALQGFEQQLGVPGSEFDFSEHWLDFDLANPQLHPSTSFELTAQHQLAPQPHFAAQPQFTVRPQPSAQPPLASQPDFSFWQDELHTVHQLPVAPEAEHAHEADPMPPIAQPAPTPGMHFQPMQPPGAFDMPPVDLAFDLDPAPPIPDLAPSAADLLPPALDLPPPGPAPHHEPAYPHHEPAYPQHEPAYPQYDASLPDWLPHSLQDEFSLLMNAPAFPELPSYAPLPDISFDFQSGADFGVGETWEQEQPEHWAPATPAGEWVFPTPDQLLPTARNIDDASWLVNPRAA